MALNRTAQGNTSAACSWELALDVPSNDDSDTSFDKAVNIGVGAVVEFIVPLVDRLVGKLASPVINDGDQSISATLTYRVLDDVAHAQIRIIPSHQLGPDDIGKIHKRIMIVLHGLGFEVSSSFYGNILDEAYDLEREALRSDVESSFRKSGYSPVRSADDLPDDMPADLRAVASALLDSGKGTLLMSDALRN